MEAEVDNTELLIDELSQAIAKVHTMKTTVGLAVQVSDEPTAIAIQVRPVLGTDDCDHWFNTPELVHRSFCFANPGHSYNRLAMLDNVDSVLRKYFDVSGMMQEGEYCLYHISNNDAPNKPVIVVLSIVASTDVQDKDIHTLHD